MADKATTNSNNVKNVTQAKPKVSGAMFIAPAGTALPTDAKTALNPAFKCMGYSSEDGLSNSKEREMDEVKAWGGDIVLNTLTSQKDKWKTKLIEALNLEALKLVYGSENVSGTLETGLTIKNKSHQPEGFSYVIDMLLRGNVLKRIVIPHGTLTSIGDIVYKDSEPIGYDVEISAGPDAEGVTHYEYISGSAA